ncbi:MAG: hypothetical protein WC623_22400 [Pedobacter sp.]|uniref:hypothetical protein n=1 Tax=Pedobacter sp. TaxID=1411316 RepID=UPI00356A7606
MQLTLDLLPPPKRKRNILSEAVRAQRKEKADAHQAFKLLKSQRFKNFTEQQKFLLKKYYGIYQFF